MSEVKLSKITVEYLTVSCLLSEFSNNSLNVTSIFTQGKGSSEKLSFNPGGR